MMKALSGRADVLVKIGVLVIFMTARMCVAL